MLVLAMNMVNCIIFLLAVYKRIRQNFMSALPEQQVWKIDRMFGAKKKREKLRHLSDTEEKGHRSGKSIPA